MDTNNGTEAQNKLFKYTFLPRKKQKATLSSTVTIIVDKYLPSVKYKYLLQNYQQLSQYRQYKSCIPPYLHDRPRSVILHCLERRTSSTKFSAQSLQVIDNDSGIFEIYKTSGGKHTVDFGLRDNTPSCTCKDWIRHHLPCKHFFTVFQYAKDWPWERLPQEYQKSAYLSTDTEALQNHFSEGATSSQALAPMLPEENESDMTGSIPDDIPTRVRHMYA